MKKIFISAALASMMMASCQNDVLVENISNEGDMFTLEVNQGGSRTALGEGFQTVWSSDDKIYVTSEDGKVSGVLSYKGTNKFTGYIFGGKSTRLSHVIFPVPVDGKVELKQPKGNRLDLPMIGELGSDKTSVEMANVCALVNLPVEGTPSIGLSSVGENTLTGHYEYKDGEFVFVPGEGSITVNVTDGKAFFATAVPTDNQGVEEDQVELKINGTDETITVPVEQGLISENNVPEIEFNEDGTMAEPVMNVTTAEILEKALNQYDEVKLAGDIVIEKPIVIAAEKNMILDLNGFDLIGKMPMIFDENNEGTAEGAVISNLGTLTINGKGNLVNAEVNGAPVVRNGGNLTLNNVTIIGAKIGETGVPAYPVHTYGTMIVNGETKISSDRGALCIDGEGETTINGGEFIHNDHQRVLTSHVIYLKKNCENTLTINDGVFKHLKKDTSGGVVVCNRSGVATYINDGEFSGGNYYGWDNMSDYGQNNGSIFIISGGTFDQKTQIAKFYSIGEDFKIQNNEDGTWTVVRKN